MHGSELHPNTNFNISPEPITTRGCTRRLALNDDSEGSYVVLPLDGLRKNPDARELLNSRDNSYDNTAVSTGLSVERADPMTYASTKAWVFEGRFSELDLPDVRHLIADKGQLR